MACFPAKYKNSGATSLKVVEAKGSTEEVSWDYYVQEHPAASGYHLIAWRRIVEESFGHHTVYLMVQGEDGEVRGVLPLVCMSSRLFGRFLVSLPFFNYGGLLADNQIVRDLLLEAAVGVAEDLKADHIELRQTELFNCDWHRKQHKVSMRLHLSDDFEVLWNGFPAKVRSQIRRAQKEGMTVRVGGEELLEDFYQVFSRNMRDLGTPVYGEKFFESILHTFPKEARICVVSLDGRPLAAAFLYGFREGLEIPWASSDRRFARLAPNMLLYSSVLEYACRSGFRTFDFGRSTPGSGTYRFKEQWGALPIPLTWQYWTAAPGELPDISPKNQKYELAIQIWKRLPIRIANLLGPSLVRNIP